MPKVPIFKPTKKLAGKSAVLKLAAEMQSKNPDLSEAQALANAKATIAKEIKALRARNGE